MGSDLNDMRIRLSQIDFNPRSPDGERRGRDVRPRLRLQDFNPRSPDGERLDVQGLATVFQHFNPRSPDGERRESAFGHLRAEDISIHAPRMGSDTSAPTAPSHGTNFNPRSPDGERLVWGWVVRWGRSISIHAPRMGSDCSARLNI